MTNEPWHALATDKLLAGLGSSRAEGLTEEEAAKRLASKGRNVLKEDKGKSFFGEMLEELTEPMILLLLVVGVLYSLSGELTDAITIFLVIAALVFVETYNDLKAGRTIRSLRTLARATVLARRAGRFRDVDSEELVPGDIIVLEAGRRVPADARVFESFGLTVDESPLTGESAPVVKEVSDALERNTPLAERNNMVFTGCLVTQGKGLACVVETGSSTELGKIAALAKGVKPPRTPLQLAMRDLTKWMVFVALGFSIALPTLAYLINGQPPQTMLLTALSLAFATIPEELPIIITMVLALGGYRLSKQRAIVKKLKAVETLGTVTVVATDKTGTLTENRMTLASAKPEVMMGEMLRIGVLCSDAVVADIGAVGEPAEVALLDAARAKGIDPDALRQSNPLVSEFAFDGQKKLMSTVHRHEDSVFAAVKGAPESVLGRSSAVRDENGYRPLTQDDRAEWNSVATKLAAEGYRLIAFAEKRLSTVPNQRDEAESELTLVGIIAFLDPPREGAKEAIATIERAGVRTIMVTGDHPQTAVKIAALLGLDHEASTMTGRELAALTDGQLQEAVNTRRVFARTDPEQKLRIVKALHANGERVAVTGDGVNDAPALAAADIGVAMGATGSDVARETADIVLADDDFGTIAKAIAEGRRLFANLSKGVKYYLACKVAIIASFLIALLARAPLPFAPIQIIMLELFMDLGASAAFVAERPEADIMNTPPRDPKRAFLDRGTVTSIFVASDGLTAAVTAAYLLTWYASSDLARSQTVAILTWLVGHFFLALNMRTDREPLLKLGIATNPTMLIWGAGALLFAAAAIALPFLHGPLRTTYISGSDAILAIGLAFIGAFWHEVRKWITYKG
ncbi:MAG TPA: cation-transporting P-type ATPase [Methanomassiliicoccales archaeon]|nr:cation-transporting P-type ATPase [Methanomassiliicoccales archaeon]